MRQPVLLARGHWPIERVDARWREEHYEPPEQHAEAADAAIAALRKRGSPSHDGLAARLVAHAEEGDAAPARAAAGALGAAAGRGRRLAVVAASASRAPPTGAGSAGRRAAWLSSWPGRWALGAGGAVDIGESPAHTLARELREEWSVEPSALTVEALVRLPHQLVMIVGLAWLPDGRRGHDGRRA